MSASFIVITTQQRDENEKSATNFFLATPATNKNKIFTGTILANIHFFVCLVAGWGI